MNPTVRGQDFFAQLRGGADAAQANLIGLLMRQQSRTVLPAFTTVPGGRPTTPPRHKGGEVVECFTARRVPHLRDPA